MTEDDTAETITISMPTAMIAKIRREAQEAGISVSKLIVGLLNTAPGRRYTVTVLNGDPDLDDYATLDEAISAIDRYILDDADEPSEKFIYGVRDNAIDQIVYTRKEV